VIGRRDLFLAGGALAGAALLPREAAAAPGSPPAKRATPTAAEIPSGILDDATIGEIQSWMRSGKQTAASLVKACFTRADLVDSDGPQLRAILERNPDAHDIADALDRERAHKGPRGPLHGVPILLKDNIDTADKTSTTAGSLALEKSIAAKDAFIVTRLRAAGAVLLGKANLSEWANIRSNFSSSGWSGRGGQTKNPHVLDRSPCGSSSGSAAAVAAGLCAAAVGTETAGSIVCPASVCGLVGLKPTVGLASRSGIIPISSTQDTAGPIARTVADAALLMSAMIGVDPADPSTKGFKLGPHSDYTKFLDPHGLRGARIGVARNLFGATRRGDRLIEVAIEDLRRAGATVIDPAEIEGADKIFGPMMDLLLFELKATLDAFLAARGAKVKSLADVIAFNEAHAAVELAWFGQENFTKAQAKGPLTSPDYLKIKEALAIAGGRDGIDATIAKHKLDAIVAPTMGPAGPIDLICGDHFVGGDIVGPPAAAGYPHLTVPAGLVENLPVGLSFVGKAWSEPTLFKLGFAYEQATRHRRAPKFLPTISVS
jgi:amidase